MKEWKSGLMKIYERYSLPERIFRGGGGWNLFLPARCAMAGLHRLYLLLRYSGGVHAGGSHGSPVKREEGSEEEPYVISVGNLVIGGGGKTPCSVALAELVRQMGGRPVVVTRGYRSRVEKAGSTVILANGRERRKSGEGSRSRFDFMTGPGATSQREYALTFGDEVSIYRRKGIPVVIDRNRRRGIETAGTELDPTDIILDDAYQNRSVRKDMDILLLDHSRPCADGRLLPLGRLREGPEAVGRADAVVFTRSEGRHIPAGVGKMLEGKHILFSRHSFQGLYGRKGEAVPPSELAEEKIALFSAIGYPESFEALVERNIHSPFCAFRFSDHHRYRLRDVEWMIEKAGRGTVFLTTEKDWFKTHELFPPKVRVLEVRMRMTIQGAEKLVRGEYD
jgi:tetraacyldisaccharide 4'-kinase